MHTGRTRELLGAIGLSLLLHAGTAVVGSRVGLDPSDAHARPWSIASDSGQPTITLEFDPPPPPPPEPEALAAIIPEPEPTPPPPPPEPKVVLGISGGAPDADSWLGFKPDQATEHEAPLANTDQPALERNPGAPGDPGDPSPPMPPSEPAQPVPALQPATPPEASPPPKTEQAAAPRDRLEAAPRMPDLVGPPAPERQPDEPPVESEGAYSPPLAEAPDVTADADGRGKDNTDQSSLVERLERMFAESDLDAAPPTDPALYGPPAPPSLLKALQEAAASAPSNPSASTGADGAAEKSPKQADPTSTRKPVVVRPGRPVAAEGLEIVTQRPQFTTLTAVTAAPGDPVVKIIFNRQGKVSRAYLLESSGNEDVDEPVLNAIYQWTAKGEALRSVPADDPKAGVPVTMRIVLR